MEGRDRAGRWAFVLAALAAGMASLPEAEAQSKRSAPAASVKAPAPKLAEIRAKLESSDPADVIAGLELAAEAGKDGASLVPVVEALLRRGASIEVAKAALGAIAELGNPSSSLVVRPYARHRRAELRGAAIDALAKTGGAEAVATVRKALGDPDPSVRGAAARALGALFAKDALDDLFLALERGVEEAAASIGALCDAASCHRLLSELGGRPFAVAASALEALLSSAQATEADKLVTIAWLGDLGTQEALEFLRTRRARMKDASPAVEQAIDRALAAMEAESPGAQP